MIEINLVPDVKQELIKAQRIRARVIVGAILIGGASIAIVLVLAFYVFGVQTARNFIADGQIKSKSDTLAKVSDLSKMLTIQNQLSKISNLNSNKNIDSRLFDVLSIIDPPAPNNIQISDLTVDSSSNLITINGQAANSYAAVDVFKKTIQGAQIKYTDQNSKTQKEALASSISLTNTSYGEDPSGTKVLRFTLSFVYPQELFSPKSSNVSVVIMTNGNATDSYLGVPSSLFAVRAKDLTGGQ